MINEEIAKYEPEVQNLQAQLDAANKRIKTLKAMQKRQYDIIQDYKSALTDALKGCVDAIGMFEGSDEDGQKIKAEIQEYYNNGRKLLDFNQP